MNTKETNLYYISKSNEILSELPDYVKTYIRSIHNRISARTQFGYVKDIQMFLNYLPSADIEYLKELKQDDFEKYLEHMERYEKNGKIYSNDRASIKRKLSSLRKFFAYLFTTGMIPADEIRKVEIPKLNKKNIIYLEKDEAADLLKETEKSRNLTKKEQEYADKQSIRDTAIIYLLLSTGIRVSECAGLDINDIDMNKKNIRIIRKGGNEDIVYFSDESSEHIQKYLDQRNLIKTADPKETALFLSSQKKRMRVRTIEIMVKKHAERAVPLKKITPHKLRATYATHLYEQTSDIYLVANALGHKDVATTKEYYARMSDRHKEQARNKVNYNKTNENE